MSYRTVLIIFFGMICVSSLSYSHKHEVNHQSQHIQTPSIKETIRSELTSPMTFVSGKTVTIVLRLLQNNKTLTLDDLKEVHTEKLHLLVIDPSLSDYHHIHPKAGTKTGEFVFEFTPKKSGTYRVWSDITPLATNQQEYIRADMGAESTDKVVINKKLKNVSTVDGYTFTLAFDGKLRAGHAVMGDITVTKNGKPFTKLEPIMGAFAHLVGFGEDYNSVLHIHPMGKEPIKDSDRGGASLKFHIEPKKPGFVALFLQVRIEGTELIVPFGILIRA